MTGDLDFRGNGGRDSLFETLARNAHESSIRSLALESLLGLVAVVTILFARPPWWAMVLPLVAVGAFGIWGIAEHAGERLEGQNTRPVRATIALLEGAAVILGIAAVAGAAFIALGFLMGTFTL